MGGVTRPPRLPRPKRRQAGLSNRWVRGNLLLTALLLLAAEVLLMLYTVNNSYAAASQALRGEIALLSIRFETVRGASERERAALLRTLVQEIGPASDRAYTLQLLDASGAVYATSDGFLPQAAETLAWQSDALTAENAPDAAANALPSAAMPAQEGVGAQTLENVTTEPPAAAQPPEDFVLAKSSADSIGETVLQRRDADSEKLLAITWLVPEPVQGISAVRLLSSLEELDNSIWQLLILSSAVVAICFFLILLTGMYFVRSIVRPLAQVEATATKIAQGNFDIRLQQSHRDEIGRLCETINHMAEELSKTERLKNEFISSVSHELRTPLTSIKGWTETLQRIDNVQDENYQRGMRIISSETDRLYDMVEELLDFSRMQSTGLKLQCTRLDLTAEMGDAVLMVQQRAAQAGLRLQMEEPEQLLAVNGDANRLRQVFVNILDNAIKYSPPGGCITVRLSATEDACAVCIRDQGPGIAADELELVKTRFYKGRGAVRGSGIGLAVADEIMQGHGGQLLLESKPGEGTAVTLLLPREKA